MSGWAPLSDRARARDEGYSGWDSPPAPRPDYVQDVSPIERAFAGALDALAKNTLASTIEAVTLLQEGHERLTGKTAFGWGGRFGDGVDWRDPRHNALSKGYKAVESLVMASPFYKDAAWEVDQREAVAAGHEIA